MNTTKKISSSSPIGVFDSGLGGLSIWKEINQLLPNESTIYLADSKNAPYGEKSRQAIIDFSIKNTEYLLSKGCKIIVVACNTATTNAIKVLRANYNIPFIGIEPAIKPAALQSKTNRIGVLATKGTLSSELFIATSEQFRNSKNIFEVEGAGLVALIEAGKIEATKPLLKKYLQPLINQDVDHIVMGCSHFPFLIPIIKSIVPAHIQIIDSGEAVAKQTKNILEQHHLLNTTNTGNHVFYTNGNLPLLQSFLKQIEIQTESVFFEEF
ncbi:MAG: glutamate racemase [Flavobacteriales bacterium CG_4_10_14_0_2_um_filter_32_8]|nr:MAG: glutamate racemase [Flavobacteriales bacterium CG_4_10_14_0_2_um_filter_32_8]PJB15525.1 MAG: glutamate racemase [Flavobacteriales bacterium CG_4_9_14_3_um_filter_32_8]